jgi:hypothetical protein
MKYKTLLLNPSVATSLTLDYSNLTSTNPSNFWVLLKNISIYAITLPAGTVNRIPSGLLTIVPASDILAATLRVRSSGDTMILVWNGISLEMY